jgi:hypothetical protein
MDGCDAAAWSRITGHAERASKGVLSKGALSEGGSEGVRGRGAQHAALCGPPLLPSPPSPPSCTLPLASPRLHATA